MLYGMYTYPETETPTAGESVYRYRVEYDSGRDFIITSDDPPAKFVQREKKSGGKVKTIFQAKTAEATNTDWVKIYPEARKY